jgi:hypothetical protein
VGRHGVDATATTSAHRDDDGTPNDAAARQESTYATKHS